MRVFIATLILCVAAPAWAGKNPGACKSQCDTNFNVCMSRAISKSAKKQCKTIRKNCKGGCRP